MATPRETAMAFAALAATGNPVLAEMQRVLPELDDDTDVRLWMALGLDAAGGPTDKRTGSGVRRMGFPLILLRPTHQGQP